MNESRLEVLLDNDSQADAARVLRELRQLARQQTLLLAVSKALAESTSLRAAAARILLAVCESFGWQCGGLWTVDPKRNALRCAEFWTSPAGQFREIKEASLRLSFAPGVGLPGSVWAGGKTTWIAELAAEANFSRAGVAAKEGLRAGLAFPILAGDKVGGIFEFFSREIAEPDDDLLRLFAGIGEQVGHFVERLDAEDAQRLQTQASLRDSEERFRQLAENIREVFWLSDPVHRKILYVSPAYQAIWGRTCESLYTSPLGWLDVVHAEDREQVRAAFLTKQAAGTYDEVYRIVRPNGAVRWIHDRGFPIRNDAGDVYRVAGVAEDITKRREAEAASQQQQQRLEGIVNSAMDGIVTIDEEQRIILVNAAAERMFGCRAEEALGQSIERFIPERFRARHGEYIREFGRVGVTTRAMNRQGPTYGLRGNGEEFPIEASISQIRVEGRKLFTVTCRDVTERVRADETRRRLEAQLQQAQKMEAFGQLAGGVAHDFNNLLTIISGYSHILLSMLPEDDPKRAAVQSIREAGESAASLTRQLLAFSRQTILDPKVLDLNAAVAETERMLRRLIGEDILLTAVLDPAISKVKADPGQLGQVLMNLAVNARDAMPKGGRLTIETTNVELDENYRASHPEVEPGRYVMLALTDTGHGMTPEIKARIFEPFFTTKGVGKGTGLGLAVVHGIAKQSGGNVEVYSEPDSGTTFKFYLPAVDEQISNDQNHASAADLTGVETVLLVEDEDSVRGLATLTLQSHGYHVLTASDGKDALRVVENQSGAIDLLVTDVVMPNMDGRDLNEALQLRFPRMAALFVSGYTGDAVIRHGLLQEEVAFLQKPYTPLGLARKVRQVLDRK